MHSFQRELVNKIMKAPVIITDSVWSKCISSINAESEAVLDLPSLANILHTAYISVINNPKPKQIVHEMTVDRTMIKAFSSPIKIVMDEELNKILIMLPEE